MQKSGKNKFKFEMENKLKPHLFQKLVDDPEITGWTLPKREETCKSSKKDIIKLRGFREMTKLVKSILVHETQEHSHLTFDNNITSFTPKCMINVILKVLRKVYADKKLETSFDGVCLICGRTPTIPELHYLERFAKSYRDCVRHIPFELF
jgi:hypothetical protein